MQRLPRLRFAPSPTGSLHLGGLRTALFNHLLARKWGGKWLLRIEDTDRTRLVDGSVEEIQRGLAWSGLDYDEGPDVGGPYGPYIQSERLGLYRAHAEQLIQSNQAYRCFCHPVDLAAMRVRLQKSGSMAGYDRTCLSLEPSDIKYLLSLNKPYCVRLHTADHLPVSFSDLIFGTPSSHSVPVDPIVVKADGFPTYHLANVVDDHAMEITHVLRGEEWIPSVPLHLTLYAAFGWEAPQFAHLPLLLNADGSKMSKRTGSGAFVKEYIERGWEPEAVLNWLAIAGWGGKRDPHAPPDPASMPSFMTLTELIAQFDLEHLTNRRSVLSPSKLEHLNKQHLAYKLDDPDGRRELVDRIRSSIQARFKKSQHFSDADIERVLVALQTRLTTLADLTEAAEYLFEEPDYQTAEALALQGAVPPDTYNLALREALIAVEQLGDDKWTEEHLKEVLDSARVKVGGMKQLMTPLRHALTGRKAGVGVAASMELLGRETVLRRLKAWLA